MRHADWLLIVKFNKKKINSLTYYTQNCCLNSRYYLQSSIFTFIKQIFDLWHRTGEPFLMSDLRVYPEQKNTILYLGISGDRINLNRVASMTK